jgi:hypothetical protein
MSEYLTLGQVPYNESAAEPCDPDYRRGAIRECQTYIQAIRNYLGHEPEGALLSYRGFPHDSGTCYEVICTYDAALPEAAEYARYCECHAPRTWAEGGVQPPPQAAHWRGNGR